MMYDLAFWALWVPMAIAIAFKASVTVIDWLDWWHHNICDDDLPFRTIGNGVLAVGLIGLAIMQLFGG